jgi:hypothetical protein
MFCYSRNRQIRKLMQDVLHITMTPYDTGALIYSCTLHLPSLGQRIGGVEIHESYLWVRKSNRQIDGEGDKELNLTTTHYQIHSAVIMLDQQCPLKDDEFSDPNFSASS